MYIIPFGGKVTKRENVLGGTRSVNQIGDKRGTTTYERLLEMPVPLVLAGLWLGGIALFGTCVLALYLLAAAVVGGT